MHSKLILACLLLALWSTLATSGDDPKLLTTPEKSDFISTSRLSEVVDFIETLQKDHPNNIRIDTLTTSTEERNIPLMFLGNPLPKSPQDLKNDKRAVVYIQANIHAGEVEGKEAVQMLMRDILQKETDDYLENVILIVCPVFNADGNAKISTDNRTHQNGPVNGVGVRHNGQLLDLNRDAMKLETPEVSAMVSVLNEYDPQVFIDLHTTNGSYRKESPAFTWMMNANTDTSLVSFMRNMMMPWVNTNLADKYDTPNCFYGEFEDQRKPEQGWVSYASEARYITNYIGLRNRLSILNENSVWADFKTRVLGCYNFLKSTLDYVSSNAGAIRRAVKEADERTIARGTRPAERDSFAVESVNTPTGTPITIQAYEMESYTDTNGRERARPTERVKPVTVPYYANWVPKRSVKYPFAYLLKYPDPDVLQLLRKHGIRIERVRDTVTLDVQTIKTIGLKPAPRLNQGHYTSDSVRVEYLDERKEIPAGTLIVRTAQPLGNLIAYLLEPETDDGLLYWNFWDKYLAPQWGGSFLPYPVTKVISAQEIVSEQIK